MVVGVTRSLPAGAGPQLRCRSSGKRTQASGAAHEPSQWPPWPLFSSAVKWGTRSTLKEPETAQRILNTQAWAQTTSSLEKCELLVEFIIMAGFITIIVIINHPI